MNEIQARSTPKSWLGWLAELTDLEGLIYQASILGSFG